MNSRSVIVLALTLFMPAIGHSETRALQFVKTIGVAWHTDGAHWMSFVSFSPDGTMVASDGPTTPDDASPRLTLWSFPDGRLIKQLSASPTSISADWKYYAEFHGVGEIDSRKALISLPDTEYAVYAFSPDSHYVAESSSGKSHFARQIRLIELAGGKEVSAFGKHHTFALSISPDGNILASGHWDGVTLWNMFTGERQGVLRGFGRYVVGMSFSQDGRLLAAGTDTGALQIWDVHRRKRIQLLSIGGLQVSAPAFSPDGSLLAVGIYGTGTVWLINVATGKIIDRQQVSDLGCGSVAFSPDGRYLIAPSTGGLIRWPGQTNITSRTVVSPRRLRVQDLRKLRRHRR